MKSRSVGGGVLSINRNLAIDKVGLVCQNFCVGRTTQQRLLVLVPSWIQQFRMV